MRNIVQYIRALIVAAELSALLFGLPIVMALLIGNPLPDRDALTVGDFSDDVIIHIGATLVWLMWAYLVLLITLDTRAQIVEQPPPALPGINGPANLMRPLLAALLAAPTIATTVSSVTATTAPAPPAAPVLPTHTGTATTFSARTTAPASSIQNAGPRPHAAGPRVELIAHTRGSNAGGDANEDRPGAAPTPQPQAAQAAQAQQPAVVLPATAATSSDGQTFLLGMGSGIGVSLIAATFYAVIGRRRRHQTATRRPGLLPALIPAEAAAIERRLHTATDLAQTLLARLETVIHHLDDALARTGQPEVEVLAARIDLEHVDLVLARRRNTPLPSPWEHDPHTGFWSLALEQVGLAGDGPTADVRAGENLSRAPSGSDAAAEYPRHWVWIGSGGAAHANRSVEQAGLDAWLLNLEAAPRIRVIGDPEDATNLVRAMALSLQRHHNDPRPTIQVDSSATELAEIPSLLQTAAPHARHRPTTIDPTRGPSQQVGTDQSGDTQSEAILHVVDDIRPASVTTLRTTRSAARSHLRLTDDMRSAPRPEEVRLVFASTGRLHASFTREPITPARLDNHQVDEIRPALDAAHAPPDRTPGPLPGPGPRAGESTGPLISVVGTPIPAPDLAIPADTPEPSAFEHTPAPDRGARPSPYANPDDDSGPARDPGHHMLDPQASTTSDAVTTSPGRASGQPPALGSQPGETPSTRPPGPADPPTSADAPPEDGLTGAPASVAAESLAIRLDPTLDSDLALWHSDHCDRPRLRLLGPVEVRANGSLPSRGQRIPWWTEVVVLLSAHPEGLTYDQLAALLWPDDAENKASGSMPRQAISAVRRWLGTDPATGQPYVPEGRAGGWQRSPHKIEGLLTDADLARRLRMRGQARGTSGLDDLQAALDLVTGPILDGRRHTGYGWLPRVPILADLTSMITEIAHALALHWLDERRPDQAEDVSRKAILAGSREDITYLDLITAAEAAKHRNAAEWWLQQLIAVHDGLIEEDLPPWTLGQLRQIRRSSRTASS